MKGLVSSERNFDSNDKVVEGQVNQYEESSENKQARLNCYEGHGVDNWSCYTDCAFWDGKKCSNYE